MVLKGLISGLCLLCLQLRAQDTLTFEQVDSVSYKLYLTENWKELQPYGQKAMRKGYDSYYLCIRTAIACYELKHYRDAVPHLKKALFYNPGDEVAMNYLYLCYLHAERFEEAKALSQRFSPAQAELMRTGTLSAIDFISLDAGLKRSDSTARFKDPVLVSAGIQHSLARRVFLFHGLTYFKQDEARFSVQQFQYYLKASFPFRQSLLLSVAGHYINDLLQAVTTRTLPGLPPAPPPPPGQPPPPPSGPPRIEKISESSTAYALVGAVNLTRFGRLFNVSIGSTAARLDTAIQYQLQAGISFFPLKNNRLAIGGTAYQHTENYFKSSDFALVPFVSAYVSPKLFLTVTYLTNTGNNIIENTGYVFNNSIDYTSERLSASASVKALKKVWLYGIYSYETKKHLQESFRYHYHLFLIGFKLIP